MIINYIIDIYHNKIYIKTDNYYRHVPPVSIIPLKI
jgi:hypothetical protein